MRTIKNIIRNEFIQGSVYFFISSFLVNLLNYGFNFLVGRRLGPSGFGEISSMFAYSIIATTPIAIFTTYIIKKVGEKTANQLEYVKSIEFNFTTSVKKMFPLFIFAVFLLPFVSSITNLSLASSTALYILIVLGYLSSFYNGALQGLRLFLAFSVIGIIATFIKFSGAISLYLGLEGIFPVLSLVVLSAIFIYAASYYYLQIIFRQNRLKKTLAKKRPVWRVFKNRYFQLVFFSTLALTILNNADVIYAKKYLSDYEAGIYASWSLFAKIIYYALSPFISITFIFFSSKSERNKHLTILKVALILLFFAFAFFYLLYTYFPTLLINILFGSKFTAILPILSFSSIFGSFYACLFFLNNFLLARGSNLALILPLFTPIYLLALLLMKKNVINLHDCRL